MPEEEEEKKEVEERQGMEARNSEKTGKVQIVDGEEKKLTLSFLFLACVYLCSSIVSQKLGKRQLWRKRRKDF